MFYTHDCESCDTPSHNTRLQFIWLNACFRLCPSHPPSSHLKVREKRIILQEMEHWLSGWGREFRDAQINFTWFSETDCFESESLIKLHQEDCVPYCLSQQPSRSHWARNIPSSGLIFLCSFQRGLSIPCDWAESKCGFGDYKYLLHVEAQRIWLCPQATKSDQDVTDLKWLTALSWRE